MILLWVYKGNYHFSLLRNFRLSSLTFFDTHPVPGPHRHPPLRPFLMPKEYNSLSFCSKLSFPPVSSSPPPPALSVTLVIELDLEINYKRGKLHSQVYSLGDRSNGEAISNSGE